MMMEAQLFFAGSQPLAKAKERKRSFAGVRLTLPSDWTEISADLPEGAVPTLAKSSGNGALQFRVYRRLPSFPGSLDHVEAKSVLAAFAEEYSLGAPLNNEPGPAVPKFAVATYRRSDDLIRVWCFTAGRSVALLTYVCYFPTQASSELSEAHAIAMSVVFDE
jgi:hypothetical protein